MTKTPTTIGDVPVPSGTEIYDALMSKIDTDLLTANIPTLDAQYAGETAEEKKVRYERYQESYKKYSGGSLSPRCFAFCRSRK